MTTLRLCANSARRVAHRIGRRGAALLIIGFADMVVGWSFVDPTTDVMSQQNVVWRDHFAPPWFWGSLWIGVGICCLVGAFLHRDTVGFGPAVALKVLWASLEFTGWQAHQIDQGYRPTVVWLAFALLMYVVAGMPERRDPPIEGHPR